MPDAAELAELDDEELGSRLTEYRRELLNLRFQLATSQLDNVARVSQVRKDIARVMTLIRDREIALAEGRELVPAPSRVRLSRRRAEAAEEEEEAAESAALAAAEAPDAEAEEQVDADADADAEAEYDEDDQDELVDEPGDEDEEEEGD
jgi:large subunit ribosomal protein L29